MKQIKNKGLWASLLIVVFVSILPIASYLKMAIIALLLVALLFFRRSVFYYIQANKRVTSSDPKDWDQAWVLYRKAIKAGLQKQFVINAASMFLQQGDAQEGKAIIETYLATANGRNADLDAIAKTMVSMTYWMGKDLPKALKTVEEVYKTGYRDKNLFVNYSTYALENGDIQLAKRLLDESKELEKSSPGLRDNRGWLYLLEGAWEKADTLYTELVPRNPRFPEPYVHFAQVKLHYGLAKEAIDLLAEALKARFTNTCAMHPQTIEAMLARLKNPATRRLAAMEIDQDTANVARGNLPKALSLKFETENAEVLSGFSERPIPTKPSPEKEEERLPNTDLTEEDLVYIKTHNLE